MSQLTKGWLYLILILPFIICLANKNNNNLIQISLFCRQSQTSLADPFQPITNFTTKLLYPLQVYNEIIWPNPPVENYKTCNNKRQPVRHWRESLPPTARVCVFAPCCWQYICETLLNYTSRCCYRSWGSLSNTSSSLGLIQLPPFCLIEPFRLSRNVELWHIQAKHCNYTEENCNGHKRDEYLYCIYAIRITFEWFRMVP